MGNPYHDPQTGEFTDGPGGGATGDKTTDEATQLMAKMSPKKAAEFQKRLDRAKRDMEMRKQFMRGRSAG